MLRLNPISVELNFQELKFDLYATNQKMPKQPHLPNYYQVKAPMRRPLKNLDLCFGRGWDHMREHIGILSNYNEHQNKGCSISLQKVCFFLVVGDVFQLQVSDPSTGKTKTIDTHYEYTLFHQSEFLGRKIGDEIEGGLISNLFDGYLFKISGASSRTGHALARGVFHCGKVYLLRKPGQFGYPKWRTK